MSWHPSRALRDKAPVHRPEPFSRDGPVPPFAGEVLITPLEISGEDGPQFEIIARWKGPPLPGTPAPAPGVVCHASDYYVVPRDRTLAQAIAGRALEQLRAGVIPDLRAIAVELRKRT